jgi:hypothetical protein
MKGPIADRRSVLAWMGAAVPARAELSRHKNFAAERLMADLEIYARAGNKQSGGAGDRWTADWIERRLKATGFAVTRQAFDVPYFQTELCELELRGQTIPLIAQPLVVQTGANGLRAPLRLAEVSGGLDGYIAVVRLPYRRWSSLQEPAARRPVHDALERGAAAVLLITTGPSGEALLLNAPADARLSSKPFVLLAPKQASAVVDAAASGEMATLSLRGQNGVRQADNIAGRIERAGRPWLAVSTPRSGWTDCVGERGPGLAIWLALAAWMPQNFPRHSLIFLCNSGHEYENLGAAHGIAHIGPPPLTTDFWLHLGANVATRDYQETPAALLPLPSADPYRFLMTSAAEEGVARRIFSGLPGLEMVYPSTEGPSGELAEVVKAGYPRHAGIFGAHRHHHAQTDNLSVIEPRQLSVTALAIQNFLRAVITAKN